MVKYLLKKRASVVHRADGGLTVLHVWAAQGEDSTMQCNCHLAIQLMLTHSLHLTAKSTNKSRKKISIRLLKSGADINAITEDGNTPLSLACFHGMPFESSAYHGMRVNLFK